MSAPAVAPAPPAAAGGRGAGRRRLGAILLWGAIPVLAVVALATTATAGLEHVLYPAATGVAGELLAGHSVGQTFIAQHDGLAAVDLRLATYARANTGTLTLHLRRNVTETQDLATVAVPAATIADNAWQRFDFSPLVSSRGQSYYLELDPGAATPGNAITVYWAIDQGDPYPYGRATYDRAPRDGDLAFGLHYSTSPLALWGDVATALASQVPGRLTLVLLVAVGACAVLLALLVAGALRRWFAPRGPRLLLLGTLLGGFALAHGLVWLVVVPPWQGPDEFAHYGYSALLAAGIAPDATGAAAQAARRRIEAGVLADMDARGFTRAVSWYPVPGGPAADFVAQLGSSSLFWETRQPPLYYRLAALLLRADSPDPAGIPAAAGLYLVRLSSVGWAVLSVLCAWACALLVARGPGLRLLWIALPLSVALLPQRAFIDATANNDLLAEALVSLLAVAVFVWLTRPRPLGRLGLAAALAGLLLVPLSLLSKTTTTAAAAPGLWLAGLSGAVALQVARLRGRVRRAAALTALPVGALLLVLLAGLLASGLEDQATAQAWVLENWKGAPRLAVPGAHSGSYVLQVAPGHVVSQRIDLPDGHPAYRATVHAWGRPMPGRTAGHLTLTVDGATVPISHTAGVLTWRRGVLPGWQPITATGLVSAGISSLRGVLRADVPMQVDDADLTLSTVDGAPAATPAANLLRNPSMEQPAVQVRDGSLLGRALALLPGELRADLILETLLNPQTFDKGATLRSYLENQYRSYWGWFGWLILPLQLPPAQYWLYGLLALLALAGWASGLFVTPRLSGPERVLGLVALSAITLAVAIGVANQMTGWFRVGLRDFPQGRYLFVLVIPALWLLLVGLGRWPLLLLRAARRPAPTSPSLTGWLGWLGLNLLLYLDLYALLVLIVPYYYGRY